MRLTLTIYCLVVYGLPASAAWITFQNDTKETIIVQELVTMNGKVVAGKPVKLQPGETLREFVPGPATKTMELLKPGQPNVSLGKHDVAVKEKDIVVSIHKEKSTVNLTVREPHRK